MNRLAIRQFVIHHYFSSNLAPTRPSLLNFATLAAVYYQAILLLVPRVNSFMNQCCVLDVDSFLTNHIILIYFFTFVVHIARCFSEDRKRQNFHHFSSLFFILSSLSCSFLFSFLFSGTRIRSILSHSYGLFVTHSPLSTIFFSGDFPFCN